MSDKDLERQEWDAGLPAPEELMPLTQTLIPRDLALAFNINLAPTDLPQFNNSTEDMLATRCLQTQASPSARPNFACLSTRMLHNPMIQVLSETAGLPPISFVDHGLPTKALKLDGSLWGSPGTDQQQTVVNLDCANAHSAGFMCLDTRVDNGLTLGADSSEGGSSKQLRKRADTEVEDVDSSLVGTENSNEDSTTVPRTLKRSRLVWTPQLHKRFVEAVAQLGLKHAVPKTIMQLMNVDGLTRENVASHLQKYRLYLKRMQGVSSEGPPMQDNLFAPLSLPLGLAGSPQFLPNHREDIIPFLMPMATGSLGVGQIDERLSFPLLPNTDLSYNNGYPQPFPCQRMSQVHLYDGRTRQGSPQRQALTLFPQNGT